MSVESNHPPQNEFELSHEEQWALHEALLDYVEVALRDDSDLPEPTVELALVERIEDGEFAFSSFELDRLRAKLERHAEHEVTAPLDREAALSVIEKFDRSCRR